MTAATTAAAAAAAMASSSSSSARRGKSILPAPPGCFGELVDGALHSPLELEVLCMPCGESWPTNTGLLPTAW